jgi:hypothetical protein
MTVVGLSTRSGLNRRGFSGVSKYGTQYSRATCTRPSCELHHSLTVPSPEPRHSTLDQIKGTTARLRWGYGGMSGRQGTLLHSLPRKCPDSHPQRCPQGHGRFQRKQQRTLKYLHIRPPLGSQRSSINALGLLSVVISSRFSCNYFWCAVSNPLVISGVASSENPIEWSEPGEEAGSIRFR